MSNKRSIEDRGRSPHMATQEDHNDYGKRGTDGLKVRTPFGTVEARGTLVVTIVLIILAAGTVLWMLREHDINTAAATGQVTKDVKLVADRMDSVIYILTLTEDQRRSLQLDMPESLRNKANSRGR